jgi:hypothetical protein
MRAWLIVDTIRFGHRCDLFIASGQSGHARIKILKITSEPFRRVTSGINRDQERRDPIRERTQILQRGRHLLEFSGHSSGQFVYPKKTSIQRPR